MRDCTACVQGRTAYRALFCIQIIERLKAAGLSIRQIERLTGINRGIISRMWV